jgi:hypothetical protein
MDEIQEEALEILIGSIIQSIYLSDMSEYECEIVIENAFEVISSMLAYEYRDIFLEKVKSTQKDLQQEVEDFEKLDSIMEEIGWL